MTMHSEHKTLIRKVRDVSKVSLSHVTLNHKLSPLAFSVIAGLACFGWALVAWLTVIPNQDILADAVQVQSLFTDPRIVLSFPGQKHAGPIEYPFQLLAELIAPANFYVHTFPRVIFAFLTGFFTARLFLVLFPQAKHWAFLAAIALGPAIIHGLSGPENNPVGVWWLVGNYDTSWLLVVIGTLLFSRGVARESRWLTVLAGIVIGLGFFAHPNVIILLIPLGTLAFLIFRPRICSVLMLLLGFVVGIIPSLTSYFFFTGNNTWDPSRIPFFVRDFYLNSLGLNGIPDYISVVLPYAFGLPASQSVINGTIQSIFTGVVLLAFTLTALIGWLWALHTRIWPSQLVLIATTWISAALGIMFFVTFVDTVWFYATSLSILFWVTVGALPTIIKPRAVALALTSVILAIEALSMFTHNWTYLTGISENIQEKSLYQDEIRETAQILQNAGVQIIYGSYLDVIPISYGSSYELRPISVRYNRFPLSENEIGEQFLVAIDAFPKEPWGFEALKVVDLNCAFQRRIETPLSTFDTYICPGVSISPINLVVQ